MRSGGVLRNTVTACVVGAVLTVGAGIVAGRASWGMGIAAGLLLGSLNGYLIQALLGRRTPFVAGSLLRLIGFSAIVLLMALVLGSAAWTVPLGIGIAQLIMVAAGVRAGLRT